MQYKQGSHFEYLFKIIKEKMGKCTIPLPLKNETLIIIKISYVMKYFSSILQPLVQYSIIQISFRY